MKHVAEETLDLNFAEEIVVEKDLRSIGVIVDQEGSKDSKDIGKNSQASSTKTKQKYYFYMESLIKIIEIVNQ